MRADGGEEAEHRAGGIDHEADFALVEAAAEEFDLRSGVAGMSDGGRFGVR